MTRRRDNVAPVCTSKANGVVKLDERPSALLVIHCFQQLAVDWLPLQGFAKFPRVADGD